MLNVIVETPQGSRNKYSYDEKQRIFTTKSLLPKGMTFPYDFGFIPSTLGDDGDPLDVLVLMEVPALAGFLVPARLIGVIEGEQSEDGKKERNDRLIAVSVESHCHENVKSLKDIEDEILTELESFFVTYHEIHGRKYKVLGRHGPEQARKLVKSGISMFKKKQKDKQKKKKTSAAKMAS
jgi:inorganic pyrophosphatase